MTGRFSSTNGCRSRTDFCWTSTPYAAAAPIRYTTIPQSSALLPLYGVAAGALIEGAQLRAAETIVRRCSVDASLAQLCIAEINRSQQGS